MPLVYAVDIGGTAVNHAVVETDEPAGIVHACAPLSLPEPTFRAVRDGVFTALTGQDLTEIAGVAISTAGSVDPAGRVIRAGAFDDYAGVDWARLIADRFPHAPQVFTVNDGRASTWAEYHHRRGHAHSLAHFAVGTSIGGGAALDGRLVDGAHGAGGGFGHIPVAPTSTLRCSCTRTGCCETLASARAVLRHYRRLMTQPTRRPVPSRRATVRTGGPTSGPGVLTVRTIARAAATGDPAARQAFRAAGHWLGIAIAAVMNTLNPTVVTVGGPLLQAAGQASADGYLGAAERAARAHALPRIAVDTAIEAAAYGPHGGLVGAALLAAPAERPRA